MFSLAVYRIWRCLACYKHWLEVASLVLLCFCSRDDLFLLVRALPGAAICIFLLLIYAVSYAFACVSYLLSLLNVLCWSLCWSVVSARLTCRFWSRDPCTGRVLIGLPTLTGVACHLRWCILEIKIPLAPSGMNGRLTSYALVCMIVESLDVFIIPYVLVCAIVTVLTLLVSPIIPVHCNCYFNASKFISLLLHVLLLHVLLLLVYSVHRAEQTHSHSHSVIKKARALDLSNVDPDR